MTLLFGTIKKYWWAGLILAALVGLWFYTGRSERDPYRGEHKQLEQMDKVIQRQQQLLDRSMNMQEKLIDLHETNTTALLQLINQNHLVIEEDKKRTHEDINRVRTYSADDIKKFFSGLDNVPTK